MVEKYEMLISKLKNLLKIKEEYLESDFTLKCDKCDKDFNYENVYHFSSATDNHIHICKDCMTKYNYFKYLIPSNFKDII